MREILFRGKRTHNDKWIVGSLHIEQFEGDNEYLCCEINQCDVYPETVGQYTGLCDKNGKKIFEGDIIKSLYANCKKNEHIEKVVFFDGSFKAESAKGGFYAKIAGQGSPTPIPFGMSVYMVECEVIGNIHDNPELLKESESK